MQHVVMWIAGGLLVALGAAGAHHSGTRQPKGYVEWTFAVAAIVLGALVWRFA